MERRPIINGDPKHIRAAIMSDTETVMAIARALSEADQSADGDYRKLAIAALEALKSNPHQDAIRHLQNITNSFRHHTDQHWERLIDICMGENG
jgi:hypothetical protein